MYKPQDPNIYNKDQIILNSGRLLLNAKEDAILLFAKKAISLSSTDSVHINCDAKPGFIVNAPKIHLGIPSRTFVGPPQYLSDKLDGQDGQEFRLVKGEIMRDALLNLLDDLKGLVDQISKGVHGKEGTPYPFMGAATVLQKDINDIKQTISDSLSTQNYTI